TVWNAVSNGPAVIAGSNPRLLDSMGIIVPAKPERFTEMNIETAPTHAKAAECQSQPTVPTVSAQIPPRMLEVSTCRLSGSHHWPILTCPVARPATTMVTDCSPVFPEIAWITGMNEASRITLLSV